MPNKLWLQLMTRYSAKLHCATWSDRWRSLSKYAGAASQVCGLQSNWKRSVLAKDIPATKEVRQLRVYSRSKMQAATCTWLSGIRSIARASVLLVIMLAGDRDAFASQVVGEKPREVSIPELIRNSDAVVGVRVLSAEIDYGGPDRKFGCGVRYNVGVFSLIDDVPELYRDIFPTYVDGSRVQKTLKLASIGSTLRVGAEYILFLGNKTKIDKLRATIYPNHPDVDRVAAEEFCDHHFPVDEILTAYDWLGFSAEVSFYFGEAAVLIPRPLKLGINPPKVYEIVTTTQYASPDPKRPSRTKEQILQYMLLRDFVKAYIGDDVKSDVPPVGLEPTTR